MPATIQTRPAPFGAITVHKFVSAMEGFFRRSEGDRELENLPNALRSDIGLLEKGAPIFVDPLVQIFAAARR